MIVSYLLLRGYNYSHTHTYIYIYAIQLKTWI